MQIGNRAPHRQLNIKQFNYSSAWSSCLKLEHKVNVVVRTLSPHELAYQESLIQEREAEIREIESGIHELSEIFRDLGTLVNEQGGMIGMEEVVDHKLPSDFYFRQHRVEHLIRGS